MRPMLAALMIVTMAASVAGCASHPVPPGVEGYRFEDIPAPQGFVQDDFLSYGHIYQRFSVYTTVFRGDSSPEVLARFYRAQMPNFGWTLVNEQTAPAAMLTFENSHERCTVNLDTEKGSNTIVKIHRDIK